MNLVALKNYDINSCLDVGAHTGNFYRELASKFKVDRWLLLEGNRECELALKNLGVPYKICLLSDTEKIVPYYRHKTDRTCTGNSYYLELTEHYKESDIEYLKTRILDSVVDGQAFDLIKLDTQGSELDILRGGENTLNNAKMVVIETSIRPYNRGAPLQAEVIDFMKSRGFEKSDIVDEVSHIYQQDILFLNTKKL